MLRPNVKELQYLTRVFEAGNETKRNESNFIQLLRLNIKKRKLAKEIKGAFEIDVKELGCFCDEILGK